VWHGTVEGLDTTFLEPENGHFWRGCIYGRNDDHVRWVGVQCRVWWCVRAFLYVFQRGPWGGGIRS
jgi:hypothetical protein